MDGEEGGLRNLKANVGKKAKRKLEHACKGGGWLTVLASSEDGTGVSRKDFRDALIWCLGLYLRNIPPDMQWLQISVCSGACVTLQEGGGL